MTRFAIPLFILVLPGCGKLFTITITDDATTTVDQGTLLEQLVGDMGFDSFLDMDLTESDELVNQGVEPGDIKDVHLTQFSLTATDPAGADLSFLQSMDLSVEGPDLPSVVVASASSFPEGQATVDFDLMDVDLTPYVVSKSMSLTTAVNGHRPDQTTDVRADYQIKVGVTGQGVKNNTR